MKCANRSTPLEKWGYLESSIIKTSKRTINKREFPKCILRLFRPDRTNFLFIFAREFVVGSHIKKPPANIFTGSIVLFNVKILHSFCQMYITQCGCLKRR